MSTPNHDSPKPEKDSGPSFHDKVDTVTAIIANVATAATLVALGIIVHRVDTAEPYAAQPDRVAVAKATIFNATMAIEIQPIAHQLTAFALNHSTK